MTLTGRFDITMVHSIDGGWARLFLSFDSLPFLIAKVNWFIQFLKL